MTIKEITPGQFVARRAGGTPMTLLDVREEWETSLAPVPSEVICIPMGQITARLGELDPARETVVICRSGGRSLQVAHALAASGFKEVSNLAGGILAWSRELDPSIPQY